MLYVVSFKCNLLCLSRLSECRSGIRGNEFDLARINGKLCNGEGYAMGLVQLCENSNVNIVVNDVDIVMHINNMNCYEYVYCFCVDPIVSVDETVIDKIYVPAMKSYYK